MEPTDADLDQGTGAGDVTASGGGGGAGRLGRVRAFRASPWFIFSIVAIALFMASIDTTIVATALPTLRQSLHSTINWAAWTITAYALGQTIALPIMGRIGDQFGRRRVFVVSIVVFTLASVACGLSTSIYMLIPLRFVQALGGGSFTPAATGIISDTFGRDRDRAIGMFNSIYPVGSICGPVIGAVIINSWSWRGIFFINLPIGVVLLYLALRFLPRSEPKTVGRLDLQGALLVALVIVLIMYGITNLGDRHLSLDSPLILGPLVLAGVAVGVFIRRSSKLALPIIPIKLLKHRTFATMNFISLVYGGSAVGFASLVPLYAEERYHMHSLQAGTLLTSRAVGSILVAGATSFLLRRIGYRLPMIVGFAIAVAGLFLLAVPPLELSTYAWLAVGGALMGIGNGISAPATNNATLSLAPGDVASISGLRGMFRQLGGILAVSITTAYAARSLDEGVALGRSFVVFAIGLIFMIPLILTVPDRRNDW